MKQLNNYILEKLHLDKDLKINNTLEDWKDNIQKKIKIFLTDELGYLYNKDYEIKIKERQNDIIIRITFIYQLILTQLKSIFLILDNRINNIDNRKIQKDYFSDNFCVYIFKK